MWKRTQKSGRALTISPRATPPSLADYGRSWWTKIMIMIMRSWSQNESVAFTVCVSSLMIIMMWGSNWEAGCTTEKEMVSWWTNKWSQNWQLSWPGPSFTQLIHSNIEMHNVCLQKKPPGSKLTLCEICVFRGLCSCTVKSFSEAENLKRRELRAEELCRRQILKRFTGSEIL